jgi:CheY-like chemotaxis protein
MQKILLIDDDEQVRRVVAIVLKRHQREVVEAGDGAAGLSLLKDGGFDIVITDILMPGKNGMETIGTVRRLFPELKIIAMSGGSNSESLYLPVAKKLGADITLAKPFAHEALIAALDRLQPPCG